MRTIISTLFLGCVVMLSASPARAGQLGNPMPEQMTIKDLINLAALNRDPIASLDVTFTTKQESPEAFTVNGQRPIFLRQQRYLFDLQHPDRYLIELVQQQSELSREDFQIALAHDGEVHTRLNPRSGAGFIETRSSDRVPQKEDPVLIAALMYPPSGGGVGLDDGSMVSLLEHGVLRDAQEQIDGHAVYVVDAFASNMRYATVWLDAERGVIPLRAVMYGEEGAMIFDQRIHEVAAFSDAEGQQVWLPVSIESESLVRGFWNVTTTEVDVDRTILNPAVPRNRFRVEFLPGTKVYDADRGTTLEIPQSR